MEGIKGFSLVGEATTVVAAVITITAMATTTDNMEMVTTIMVNTTMANTTMDITTTATTTMVSAMDSQMEVDVSVTTDSPSETSMETRMEPVKGQTTRGGHGATQRGGATLAAEICKPQNGSQATRGLIGPVDIVDSP